MTNIRIELMTIDGEIQANGAIPSRLIYWQNEKLKLILASLIPTGNGCLEMPLEFQGKFKTVGYYGKRITLPKALKYFANSLEDTIETQEIDYNLFRSCENINCFNPEHLVGSQELRAMKLGMQYKEPIRFKGGKTPIPSKIANPVHLSEEDRETARLKKEQEDLEYAENFDYNSLL